MPNKLYQHFEDAPQELKDSLRGDFSKTKEKFKIGEKIASERFNKKRDKIHERISRGNTGVTKRALSTFAFSGRNGILGIGSSRLVFDSTSIKNIIKMPHTREGIVQNSAEFKILSKLGTQIQNSLGKRKKVNELLPTLLDYDKESVYAKRGIPLWLEFKKLQRLSKRDQFDFAEKYGLLLDGYYTIGPKMTDRYIEFDEIWQKKNNTIKLIPISEIKSKLELRAVERKKLGTSQEIPIVDSMIKKHLSILESKNFKKLYSQLKELQKEGLIVSDLSNPDNWGRDGDNFKIIDLGFTKEVIPYYKKKNK